MICLTPKPCQIFFVYPLQSKDFYFTEEELFKGKREWKIKLKKTNKRRLLSCSHYGDQEEPHDVNKEPC